MKNAKKVLIVLITTIITISAMGIFGSKNTEAATNTFKTENTSPKSGNIFVTVSGNYTTVTSKQVLDRINQIRKEACQQGVKNPVNGKKLTMSDYTPLTWCYDLEQYARLRSAEASVKYAHTRPANTSTFRNNININGYHSAENLAMGYDIMRSIEAYYKEKATWVNGKSGVTGHYTNLINPKNTLVGVAAFKQTSGSMYTAMEFGHQYTTCINHSKNNFAGKANQIIEANVDYLVKSVALSGSNKVKAGKKVTLTATANMKGQTKNATISKGAKWTSSNSKVATVDSNGVVTAKAAGTTTIKVTVKGANKTYTATYKITVSK